MGKLPNESAILQKLQLLEAYVHNLRGFTHRSHDDLRNDVGLAWAVQHGLQVSIQCVIDVCQLLVAGLALGPPASSVEAMDLLRDAGVFPAPFAQTLGRMARFRNVLVHAYAQVDLKRVHESLMGQLDDFGRFAADVLSFLSKQGCHRGP